MTLEKEVKILNRTEWKMNSRGTDKYKEVRM